MLNQLLNDPYFELIDPIKVDIKVKFNVKHDIRLEDHDLVMIILGDTPTCVFEYNGIKLTSEEDYKNLFNIYPLEKLEDSLLFEILYLEELKAVKHSKSWKDMNLTEKLNHLEISEYAADRNLNDLIMYIYFLRRSY